MVEEESIVLVLCCFMILNIYLWNLFEIFCFLVVIVVKFEREKKRESVCVGGMGSVVFINLGYFRSRFRGVVKFLKVRFLVCGLFF